MTGQYEIFSKENKGLFRVDALSCDEFPIICAKEKVTKFPTFRVYPPFPAPTVDYEEDVYSAEKIKNWQADLSLQELLRLLLTM